MRARFLIDEKRYAACVCRAVRLFGSRCARGHV